MADGEGSAAHAGSYNRVPWSLDYLCWVVCGLPGRLLALGRPGLTLPDTVLGMDVSHWQGELGQSWWDAAYGEGYRFVFLKATEGRSLRDARYAANKSRAQEAGFKVGAYHFARPQYGGQEQAELFLEVAGDLDLGGVWDLEYAGGVSGPMINVRTEEFLSVLNQRYGFSWMYSAAWFLDPRKIDPRVPYLRWVAHWTRASSPYMPRIWRDREYDAWQYSARGRVAGKRGIDLNRMQKAVFDRLTGG
jgi:lysozyme